MKKSFLNREKPWLTLLFRPKSADIALDTIHRAISDGVEAFCLQTEALCPEDRNPETYRKLFAAMGERPVYTTNYRRIPTRRPPMNRLPPDCWNWPIAARQYVM